MKILKKKLRAVIQNPESAVPKAKFVALKDYIAKNEQLFLWFDDETNKFLYNELVYYLAQIIKLTITLVDKLATIEKELAKEKKTKRYVIKKIKWDSYKKIVKKPTKKSRRVVKIRTCPPKTPLECQE